MSDAVISSSPPHTRKSERPQDYKPAEPTKIPPPLFAWPWSLTAS